MQASRRAEYGRENSGGDGANPAGCDEARAVLETGQGGAGPISGAVPAIPAVVGSALGSFPDQGYFFIVRQ